MEIKVRILAIVSGEYGHRHVNNIRTHGPSTWEIEVWQAPMVLPPVIDYPEDHLPEALPNASLILSFAEHRGVAELIPEIAQRTGASAVIAAIDNEAWLPRGLANQLRGWLEDIGVVCVTPKPLCSLNETYYYAARRKKLEFSEPHIAEFARHFGQPSLELDIDQKTRRILSAVVQRDTVCGCARHVAEHLDGLSVDEAEEKAGLLHHHFPCLAAMGKDPDYGDTLMHISGNLLKDNVNQQVKPHKQIQYYAPSTRSE
jgi:hypothetical protein